MWIWDMTRNHSKAPRWSLQHQPGILGGFPLTQTNGAQTSWYRDDHRTANPMEQHCTNGRHIMDCFVSDYVAYLLFYEAATDRKWLMMDLKHSSYTQDDEALMNDSWHKSHRNPWLGNIQRIGLIFDAVCHANGQRLFSTLSGDSGRQPKNFREGNQKRHVYAQFRISGTIIAVHKLAMFKGYLSAPSSDRWQCQPHWACRTVRTRRRPQFLWRKKKWCEPHDGTNSRLNREINGNDDLWDVATMLLYYTMLPYLTVWFKKLLDSQQHNGREIACPPGPTAPAMLWNWL